MEDIFSVGEKWIRSVASSSLLTRTASGRPEVSYRSPSVSDPHQFLENQNHWSFTLLIVQGVAASRG